MHVSTKIDNFGILSTSGRITLQHNGGLSFELLVIIGHHLSRFLVELWLKCTVL